MSFLIHKDSGAGKRAFFVSQCVNIHAEKQASGGDLSKPGDWIHKELNAI